MVVVVDGVDVVVAGAGVVAGARVVVGIVVVTAWVVVVADPAGVVVDGGVDGGVDEAPESPHAAAAASSRIASSRFIPLSHGFRVW